VPFVEGISFGLRSALPVILQAEATECGLACLAMVSSYHGHRIDLATLRSRHSVSLKGATLTDVVAVAEEMKLASRALKLELEQLRSLTVPCILHWDFDHFVVLKCIRGGKVTIHDPAIGIRTVTFQEVSKSFTGVALELWPSKHFVLGRERQRLHLRDLVGRVSGVARSLGHVLILATVLEVFTLLSPFYLQWVVDEAISAGDMEILTALAIGFGLLLIIRVAVSAARSWVLMRLGTTLSVQWRANVFAHLLKLPMNYFQKRHLGDISSRFASVDHIQNTMTTSFVEAILDGVMSIATMTMMYIYSPMLATIATVTMVLYAILRWAWYGSLMTASASQIALAAQQHTHFLESVRGIRAIKLFQRHVQRRMGWLAILVDEINAGLRAQKMNIVFTSLNTLLVGVQGVVVIWVSARMVMSGTFTIGALMAFKAYNDHFGRRLSGLIDGVMQFKLLRLHGERLADIVLSEPEGFSSSVAGTIPSDLPSVGVEFSDVHVRYGPSEPTVLRGVTFAVKPGETVAITGPSGGGKSTLINVLLGLLPISRGEVSIGGTNIQHLGSDGLRSIVGCVLQDDVLLSGSLMDNISFFDPQIDRAWVEDCAKAAHVHDDIIAMPMGYHTLVGDMGTVLSGGQKQRILLARALYKKPKLLLLDEATSHLDVEKERVVCASIREMQVTKIIVAHRPETLASAHRTLVLQDGKVVYRPIDPAESATQRHVPTDTKFHGIGATSGIGIAPLGFRSVSGNLGSQDVT
jgi:ATP-binding cassette, subfamily B, bacterial CvaB/MchF/RaxB